MQIDRSVVEMSRIMRNNKLRKDRGVLRVAKPRLHDLNLATNDNNKY